MCASVHIAMRQVVVSGRLGLLAVGSPRDDIRAELGAPDHNATASDARWRYGDLELEFDTRDPGVLAGFNIHAFTDLPRLPGGLVLDPWFFRAGARIDEVMLALASAEVPFRAVQMPGDRSQVYVITRDRPLVRLQFMLESDGDWARGLHGIWVSRA